MKQNIVVVDEEDKIIDHKSIDAVDREGLRYRVSALWIKNSKGESLLARRAYSKSHDPGKWGPAVAGTVDEGESYEENIIKEAEEELGLEQITVKKGPKTKSNEKYKHFTQWYTYKIDKPAEEFKIQEEEVAEVKWFSNEELKNQLKNNPENFLKNMNKYVELFY